MSADRMRVWFVALAAACAAAFIASEVAFWFAIKGATL